MNLQQRNTAEGPSGSADISGSPLRRQVASGVHLEGTHPCVLGGTHPPFVADPKSVKHHFCVEFLLASTPGESARRAEVALSAGPFKSSGSASILDGNSNYFHRVLFQQFVLQILRVGV